MENNENLYTIPILLSTYWILQHLIIEYEILGSGIQFFISLYTYKIIIDYLILLRNNAKEQTTIMDLSSILVLRLLTILLMILPLTAGYRMSMENSFFHIDDFILFLIAPAIILVSYSWVLLSSYYTNMNKFVSYYCVFSNFILLSLVSYMKNDILLDVVYTFSLLFMPGFYWIKLYYVNSIVLIINNLMINKKQWGVKITFMQSIFNVLLFLMFLIQLENQFDAIASNYSKLAIMLMMAVCIPQLWLTSYVLSGD